MFVMAMSDRAMYPQAAEPRPIASERDGAQRRRSGMLRARHVRWVVGIVLFALFAGVLSYLVHDEMRANDQVTQTRSSLAAVQAQLSAASQQLALARRDLSLVSTQVGSDSTALTQDVSQLKAAQSALLTAQSQLSQQTAQIGSLHKCLGGVEQALNALAVKRQGRAIQALRSVSTSCQAAASE
jgi:multidrug efflux pump subunit AcrA (membrane-fusion protein)